MFWYEQYVANALTEAPAMGFCKLLFPHTTMSEGDFREYCLKPAVKLRQRVRDQLCLLDPEYEPVQIGW